MVSSNSVITVSAWVREDVRHDSNGGVIIEFSDGRAIVAPGTQSAPTDLGLNMAMVMLIKNGKFCFYN